MAAPNSLDHIQDILGVTVGRIHGDDVRSGSNQGLHPLLAIRSHTHCRSHAQPPSLVFTGEGVLGFLLYVLDGDQPFELKFFIHHQKFFNPVAVQDLFSLIEIHPGFGSDQIFLGHDLRYRPVQPLLEAQIPVGQDPHQTPPLGDGKP